MAYYDLPKEERQALVRIITDTIVGDLTANKNSSILLYFSDSDTYIRKEAYLAVGRVYFKMPDMQGRILVMLRLCCRMKTSGFVKR